jgi:hypothetical protein
MWLSVNEKELKAFFEGLKKLVWNNEGPKPAEENRRSCPVEPEIRQVLHRYLNQDVEIGTEAGSIAGVLQALGADYVQLLEAGGSVVILSFTQINFVQSV